VPAERPHQQPLLLLQAMSAAELHKSTAQATHPATVLQHTLASLFFSQSGTSGACAAAHAYCANVLDMFVDVDVH
jgi:hypothetical protein